MRSAPARSASPAPCSALAQAFSGMSAHRPAPAHLVFCPLPAISAPLSAHMRCSYARLCEALSAVAPETELVQSSYKHVFIIYLFIYLFRNDNYNCSNKLCGRLPQYAPAPCKLTFDHLTL